MIDKHQHIQVGLAVQILQTRCDVINDQYDSYELQRGKVFVICEGPEDDKKKNGAGGVWVQGEKQPLFVWYFEWKPFYGMVRTKEPIEPIDGVAVMERTK